MAPSGSSSATSSRLKTRRKPNPRIAHSVKKKKKQNPQERNIIRSNISNEKEMMISSSLSPAASCCSNNDNDYDHCTQTVLEEIDISDDNGCSTPKAERFRISQVSTCPPPPKKPKSLPNNNFYNHHRSPIPFFASPELELFFLGALRDISV